MNYRSVADVTDAITTNLHRLPRDIDLVVGIPRSGILAASLFSLVANIPMTDFDAFLENRTYSSGVSTKRRALHDQTLADMRRILILDDSIQSGKAMRIARERFKAAGIDAKVVFAAIYGSERHHAEADFIFERVKSPRIFQWNFMHHIVLEKSCVEIDGVLCRDPAAQESDDGEAYRQLVRGAVPLYTTSRRIGYLVTNRPERYRALTESWLKEQDIDYGELIMLSGVSEEEGLPLGGCGGHKAQIYRELDSNLFIESERSQAETIARLAGKPVLCIETHQMYLPDILSVVAAGQQLRQLPTRLKAANSVTGQQLKGVARSLLGHTGYSALKRIVRARA